MLQVVENAPNAPASEAALTAHRASDQAPLPGGWRQVEALPVGLFAAVMGLTGLSVAWTLAQARYGTPPWIGPAVGVVATVAALRIATAQPGPAIDALALGLLALTTLIIAWLLARTLIGLFRGELRTLAQ